jgi:hypothetical protein
MAADTLCPKYYNTLLCGIEHNLLNLASIEELVPLNSLREPHDLVTHESAWVSFVIRSKRLLILPKLMVLPLQCFKCFRKD